MDWDNLSAYKLRMRARNRYASNSDLRMPYIQCYASPGRSSTPSTGIQGLPLSVRYPIREESGLYTKINPQWSTQYPVEESNYHPVYADEAESSGQEQFENVPAPDRYGGPNSPRLQSSGILHDSWTLIPVTSEATLRADTVRSGNRPGPTTPRRSIYPYPVIHGVRSEPHPDLKRVEIPAVRHVRESESDERDELGTDDDDEFSRSTIIHVDSRNTLMKPNVTTNDIITTSIRDNNNNENNSNKTRKRFELPRLLQSPTDTERYGQEANAPTCSWVFYAVPPSQENTDDSLKDP